MEMACHIGGTYSAVEVYFLARTFYFFFQKICHSIIIDIKIRFNVLIIKTLDE